MKHRYKKVAMNTMYSGKLISLEGIDGCGKSTLANSLANHLTQSGHAVVLTKEHGGTPLGVHLRAILHHRKDPMCHKAEFLILAADRAQHIEQVVIPALQAGKLVISDRMNDSSVAYQGYGRGLDLNMIRSVNTWAMRGSMEYNTQQVTQDLVIFIDIEPQLAMERFISRNEQLTAFEQEKLSFWQRVRNGYHEIFKERPEVITLDGRCSPEELLHQALVGLNKRGIIHL